MGRVDSPGLSARVEGLARARPGRAAYVDETGEISWSEYVLLADALRDELGLDALPGGARVAVLLPDGIAVHAAYLACERAGLVIVGLPDRAGDQEIAHLLGRTDASVLISLPERRGRSLDELRIELERRGVQGVRFVAVDPQAVRSRLPPAPADVSRRTRPDELWLINSTSGTTGLPKCVVQVQDRWALAAAHAAAAASITADDRVLCLVPAPFGFGLWAAHFLPAEVGCSTVLMAKFDAERAVRTIEEQRITVLACVTTQFVMMLQSPAFQDADLSSLRVMFTGGEKVPRVRSTAWEQATGSKILQFYGSNEAGPVSCTALADDDDHRLDSVGRLLPGVKHRLYDEAGAELAEGSGVPGRLGVRGPGTYGARYWDDPEANDQLYAPDGFLLMPDVVLVDDDRHVTIQGRTSDFIIRGGKNISAAVVEDEVSRHPAVKMVAVVPVPDEVFGERVCAVVTERVPGGGLTLADVTGQLAARGVSREYWPERLVIVADLPMSTGGKIAKKQIAALVATTSG